MRSTALFAAILAALAFTGVSGCGGQEEGPGERAGKAIDDAMESARESAEDAMDSAEEAAQEARDSAAQAMEDLSDDAEEAKEKAEEGLAGEGG